MPLRDLDLQLVFDVAGRRGDWIFTHHLRSFEEQLNAEPVIRLLVDGTSGMGHQASSINVLRTLTRPTQQGLGYPGTVEIYYQQFDPGYGNTLHKIKTLLPEVQWQTVAEIERGRLHGATLELRQYPSATQVQTVTFGFTGGADSENQPPDPLPPHSPQDFGKHLRVTCFLRLQPYRWNWPNQVQRDGQDPLRRDLDTVRWLGGNSYRERAYFLPSPGAPVWQNYTAGADPVLQRKAEILQWLTHEDQLKRFDLCAVYGFRNEGNRPLTDRPAEALVNFLCAVLVSQGAPDQIRKQAKPAIVVNLDNLDIAVPEQSFEHMQAILSGVACGVESQMLAGFDREAYRRRYPGRALPHWVQQIENRMQRRRVYYESIQAENRLNFHDAGTKGVRDVCNNWLADHQNRVLFLQLGTVPPDVFNFVFASSTLPTVFEGQNTANLALNLGNAYLHVARRGDRVIQYPTTVLGTVNAEAVAVQFQEAANQINTPLSEWPEDNDANPSSELGRFIRRYMTERAIGPLHGYLTRLKEFYAKERNDKLKMGMNYLGFVMDGRTPALTARATGMDPLGELYDEIKAEVDKTGKVSLWPGLFARQEQLGEFYQVLLKELGTHELVLNSAQVSKEAPEGNEIVRLSGESSALGPSMSTVFEFTAPDGKIESTAIYSLNEAWSPDNLPWIRLGKPFVQIDVAESGLPVVGVVGGQFSNLNLGFSFPVEDGQWLFKGDFGDNGPGLQSVYDLFGGVNLLSSLPKSITTLGSLKLGYIEALYESNATPPCLQYISATAVASQPLKLPPLEKVALEDLTLVLTVSSPGDTSSRQLKADVSGSFKMNNAAVIAVSASAPQLVFQGQLVSGEIDLDDLLALFAPKLELDWPELPKITDFSFNYDSRDKSWEVSCALGINWPIEVQDKPIFTIERVGLRTSNARSSLSGSVTILPNDPEFALALSVVAEYLGKDKGLRFEGRQTGGKLPLGALMDKYVGWQGAPAYDINGLSFTAETRTGAYFFTGKTAEPWSLPFLPNVTISAAVALGCDGSTNGAGNYHGSLSAELVLWDSIDILLTYEFDTQSRHGVYSIMWAGAKALLEEDKKEWSAKLTLSGYTLGGLVETFISWATGTKFGLAAPWNVLDEISLDGLALTFNITTREVKLVYGLPNKINLGLVTISTVHLIYQPEAGKGEKKVAFELEGAFLWDIDPQHGDSKKLSWDPTKPEQTPSPPGGGSKYFDLRLLALGQHVSICADKPFESVQEAIERMRDLAVPSSEDLVLGECTAETAGQPWFNPDSGWLIAADFGILRIDEKKDKDAAPMLLAQGMELMPRTETAAGPNYVLQMSIIFNDPNLYALRVALAGEQAKMFAGLDFQIIYQRVTDTIGVYKSEITLPEVMRQLDIGAYSVTLPSFAIEIYTNGDFKVDLGFPWQLDFTRSFTVQGIVPPAIPLLGSGGLYFGKLSGATSSQVPKHTAPGQFNPVLVFGFGMQVGVGKVIEKGILRAGFSITVFGIIEGVIASWNPITPSTTPATRNQLQGEYYFWLQGSAGIIGKLFGTVDFAIIKADVNVELKIYAQITVESYANIPISVVAQVDIAVSLKINLGLFSIKIHFSFHARIKETLVIENPDSKTLPPWSPDARGLLARHQARLTYARSRTARSAAETPLQLVWDNYQAPATPTELTGYFVPLLSADDSSAQGPQACYVALLFMETVAPPGEAIAAPTENGADKSFESLCKEVLRWVIAAAQKPPSGPNTPNYTREWIDGYVVPKQLLEQILQALSDPADPVPVSAATASAFVEKQFSLTLSHPDKSVDMTVFAMPPELTLEVPAYNGFPALSYRFADFNELDPAYIGDLRRYFDELAVQVQQEMDQQTGLRQRSGARMPAGPSMASFCFGDYFLLLLRQMVQGALDGLRDFKYSIRTGETAQSIIDWVNQNMASAPESQGDREYDKPNHFTAELLFGANARHPLNAVRSLQVEDARYRVGNGDTFSSIAALEKYGKSFTAEALASRNADVVGILTPGTELAYPDKHNYQVKSDATLASIATDFGVTPDELIEQGTVHDEPIIQAVLAPLTMLTLPTIHHTTATDNSDTLEKVAARYGIDIDGLARNAHNINDVTDLFAANQANAVGSNLDITHLDCFRVGQLLDEIQRSKGLQHLSGMASRYSLHGLRLPTKGITPKHPRLAAGGGGSLPEMRGLYALTGQQFPVPPLLDDEPFSFSLSKSNGPAWVVFTGGTSKVGEDAQEDELQFVVEDNDDLASFKTQVRAVQAAAVRGIMPRLRVLGSDKPYETRRATYPLRSSIVWQTPDPVELPCGGGADTSTERQELRIWSLSESVVELAQAPGPSGSIRRRPLRFTAQIGTYNEATSRMQQRPSDAYGFGTLLEVGIKQVPVVSASPTTGYTYELNGATERGIVLLERLLADISHSDAIIQDLTLLHAPSATGDTGEGLQSAGNSQINMFISQVNLTTETRPPGPKLSRAASKGFHQTPGCGNTAYDFVKLLWENSITRSGGYYLYYYNKDREQGFPERIFDNKGEATIQLLVSYATAEPHVASYMTNVITGDTIDHSRSVVFAQADPRPAQYQPQDSDSLESIAWSFYMTSIEVAEQNPDHPLTPGKKLIVTGGSYLVSPLGTAPGGKLSDIGAHFGTSVEAIEKANPELPGSDLSADTAIRLPPIETSVGVQPTFARLAAFYGCSVADLGYANASTPGLLSESAALSLAGGPNLRAATVPPGAVAIGARRQVPAETPDDPDTPDFGELYLQHNFTTLGYRICANTQFNESKSGLPMGPIESRDDNDSADKVQEVLAQKAPGEEWRYHTAISYLKSAKKATSTASSDLPDPSQSPYIGVGDILQLEFAWQDIFGNVGHTPLADPSLDPEAPPNKSPLLLGYTDSMIGLGAWPGVTSAYYVPEKVQELRLVLAFDASRYDPSQNDSNKTAWQKNAEMDLRVYRKIYYQLSQTAGGDAGNVRLSLVSSLFKETPVDFSPAQLKQLLNWLGQIWVFLSARTAGDSKAGAPAAQEIVFSIAPSAPGGGLNPRELFELTVAVCISRPISAVKDALKNTNCVFDVSTVVSPLLRDKAGNLSIGKNSNQSYTLESFARDFEQTLSLQGKFSLKIATGVDRHRVGTPGTAQRLWVVRVGVEPGRDGISYSILNPGKPRIYSPRPILNKPKSESGVPIWDYPGGGKAIDHDAKPSRYLDFTGVDMDVWARTFVEVVDYVLSPEFVSPMKLVAERGALRKDYLDDLLGHKNSLAESISKLVIPVFAGEQASERELRAAQEAFKQQLLVRLANAYSTNAVIQFQAETSIAEVDAGKPPRLFGTALNKTLQDNEGAKVSLSSAKITLDQVTRTTPALLTFLLENVDTQAPDQAMRSHVPLDLWFQGSHIEHEIEALPGIDGYEASSWLTFVNPPRANREGNAAFQADLGSFDVPLPLRALPTPPTLRSQSGVATPAQNPEKTTLDEALQWNYSLLYSEDYHAPQDETKIVVRFNVQEAANRTVAVDGLFAALAQFVTVYPAVQEDLENSLRTFKPTATDSEVAIAAAAIDSFVALTGRVAGAWNSASARGFTAAAAARGEAYEFTITETVDDDKALLVRLTGQPPPGIGMPSIGIAGYTTESTEEDGGYRYKFKDEEGYLPASTGQAITDRTVILPNMNVLERQDAWASAKLIRNRYLLGDNQSRQRRATASSFIYETPEAGFPNPYHPTLNSAEAIDIALVGSTNGKPANLSLPEHLSTLLHKLFEKTTQTTCMIQIECRYEYAVNAGLAPIRLPIFLQAPRNFNVETDSEPTPDTAVSDWASTALGWLQVNQPTGAGAALHFDLTVFSNLTRRPMPLLRLWNLRLALQHIKPSPLR